MTPATRHRGPLPRTPHCQIAQRRATVKSSPTGPRAARREAVPLDRRAERSYPGAGRTTDTSNHRHLFPPANQPDRRSVMLNPVQRPAPPG
jgi:hypothetical protein